MNLKRRALIIGNMGIEKSRISHYLEGVQEDLVNFYDFIRSDNGGAWNADEVMFCKPNEVNHSKLLDIIKRERLAGEVDYWLVFFSGHGWGDRSGESWLEICPREKGDCDISITEFIKTLGPTRVLLITDACRALPMMESGRTLKLNCFSDTLKTETDYRKDCREIYCQKIMQLPTNTVYRGYSCVFGETSNDSGVYGGEYIHAIIETAKTLIKKEKSKKQDEEKYPIYAYPFVHALAKPIVINKTIGTQNPIYIGPKTWQPPFCVIP